MNPEIEKKLEGILDYVIQKAPEFEKQVLGWRRVKARAWMVFFTFLIVLDGIIAYGLFPKKDEFGMVDREQFAFSIILGSAGLFVFGAAIVGNWLESRKTKKAPLPVVYDYLMDWRSRDN